jgi:hypothetical protein
MRRFRRSFGWLSCLLLVAATAFARAEAPPDPLRLIPDKADVIIKVDQPRKLVETFYNLEIFKQFLKLDALKEAYDSTNSRRFFQLVAYYEKQLGMKWPDLLDRLAGGGMALGVKIGDDPAPALFVMQARDDKLLHRFVDLTLKIAEQELARQETKDRVVKGSYRNVETVQIGKQFFGAVVGSALLTSNNVKALQLGIDLHMDGGKSSVANLAGVAEARKLLPNQPLAWGWLNFEGIKQFPQAKVLFAEKQNDTNLTVLAGSFLDLIRRSPFVCAGLYTKDNSLLTTIRFPRGREGMPEKVAVWVPPVDQPGSLPLLEPKNVILSSSYYLDVSKFYKLRDKLFNEQQVKAFEQFDKRSGTFLGGVQFSKLLMQAGSHQRLVIAQQTKPGYKTKPNQLFPAGALILEMRDPKEFGKSMETILRTVALLTTSQFDLKLVEAKHGDSTIIGYRFPEADGKAKGPLRNDVNNIRYNFSPCFVRVREQFVISSTIELAGELVDLIDKQTKEKKKGRPAVGRTRIYATGGAAIARAFYDQLLIQTILGRAVAPEKAEQEVKDFIDLVGQLGHLQIEEEYTKNSFHYDIQWQLGK